MLTASVIFLWRARKTRADFQTHFKEIAKQHSPEPRRFYVHLTSVVVRPSLPGTVASLLIQRLPSLFFLQDTKETAATLRTVEEGILRDSLRRADLL